MATSKLESIITSLRNDVERRFGQRLKTATDFGRLANEITIDKAGYISVSTLKRYWGYVDVSYTTKRQSSLDILARYVGYKDFNHYAASFGHDDSVDSDFNSAMVLDVQTLLPATRISITWHPDHSIVAVYESNLTFRIVESKGSRLSVGTGFRCLTLVKGQPLIMTLLLPEPQPRNAIHYIAGKRNGIDWEIL